MKSLRYGVILQQISTHKAVEYGDKIKIFLNGITIDDLVIADEFLYSIPLENKDDLFAIFERYKEDNRINVAEANAALQG